MYCLDMLEQAWIGRSFIRTMLTLKWFYCSMHMFYMTCYIRFGWSFIRTMLTQKRFKFIMDGCYMDFELAASSCFVRTSSMRAFIVSNFVMNCLDMSDKPFTACKRLRTLVTQKRFDLKNVVKLYSITCIEAREICR